MDLPGIIITTASWLNENVCQEITLKVPSEDKEPNDDTYQYKSVHPTAFPLFIPTRDKLPPNVVSNIPSICVQLINGVDTMHEREVTIALGFGTWNPGPHKQDWINWQDPEDPVFRADMSGWMDAWNMVDIAARKIQSTNYLGENLEVMLNEPMDFGPYRQPKENVDDEWQDSFYPFWFAYLRFKVRCTLLRNNQDFEKFL